MNFFWTDDYKIEPAILMAFLGQHGYRRFYFEDKNKNPLLIRSKDNVLEPIINTELFEYCYDYVKSIDIDKKSKIKVLNGLHSKPNLYSPMQLTALPKFKGEILRDDSNSAYFPFKNGVVKVTNNSISLNNYGEFENFVWEKHIIDHDIKKLTLNETLESSFFYVFLKDICNSRISNEASKNRYERLISMMGYLMHNFRSKPKSYAIILMDELLNNNPNGGTGKGLLMEAIGKMRKVSIIDGKSLDLNQRFAFQQVDLDTEIIQFDDIEKNFNFEKLFSAITEGISVEQKNKDKFSIPFESSPKIAITTNYAINGFGSSHRRRKLEFDITSYYNDERSPYDKFGHQFFEDWDTEQWNSFYNLMLYITKFYLKKGIVAYSSENLEAKHLLNETSQSFVEFSKGIEIGKRYNKNELYKKFVDENGESSITSNKFTKYLGTLANIKRKDLNITHSDSDYYFEIR